MEEERPSLKLKKKYRLKLCLWNEPMEREENGCDVLRYGVHTDAKNTLLQWFLGLLNNI